MAKTVAWLPALNIVHPAAPRVYTHLRACSRAWLHTLWAAITRRLLTCFPTLQNIERLRVELLSFCWWPRKNTMSMTPWCCFLVRTEKKDALQLSLNQLLNCLIVTYFLFLSRNLWILYRCYWHSHNIWVPNKHYLFFSKRALDLSLFQIILLSLSIAELNSRRQLNECNNININAVKLAVVTRHTTVAMEYFDSL